MFSGKTTAATYLVNEYNYTRLAFAEPVKRLSADILSLVEERIGRRPVTLVIRDASADKLERLTKELGAYHENAPSDVFVHTDDVEVLKQNARIWTLDDVEASKGHPSVRKLLQLVGTELGRQLVGYEDVWVDKLIAASEFLDNVVVDDCRFPNEAEALRKNGFVLVRVTRPEKDRIAAVKERYPDNFEEILSHPSETSLDDFEADITMWARTLDELHEQTQSSQNWHINLITKESQENLRS